MDCGETLVLSTASGSGKDARWAVVVNAARGLAASRGFVILVYEQAKFLLEQRTVKSAMPQLARTTGGLQHGSAKSHLTFE